MELGNEFENRIEGIRMKLQRIGRDFSDCEFSGIKPSQESGEWSSYVEGLDDYEENSIFKLLQIKSEQISSLKGQIKTLNSMIEERDKNIFIMEKEKQEIWREVEKLKESFKDLKEKEETWINEKNNIITQFNSIQFEKSVLEKDLNKSLKNVERLKRSLRIKNDAIYSSNLSKSIIDAPDAGLSSRAIVEDSKLGNSYKRLGATLDAEKSYKIICLEAMKIIGVSDTKNFYSKLYHISSSYKINKKSKKLIQRLSDLVIQCSPSNTFTQSPTYQQIWRWITSLVEEYMNLKNLSISSNIEELLTITNSKNPSVLLEKISKIFKN